MGYLYINLWRKYMFIFKGEKKCFEDTSCLVVSHFLFALPFPQGISDPFACV